MSKYVLNYDILVSCPSDMQKEVDVITKTIEAFNKEYAKFQGVHFNVCYWGKDVLFTHGRPQELINNQIVVSSDMIIALFGRRLGSNTGKYPSGTIEEIELMIENNKPTLICFSKQIISTALNSSELEELLKVKKFQEEYNGLYITFENDDELREKIDKQLKLFISNGGHPLARQTPICSIPFAYQENQNDRETILAAKEITFCARTGKSFMMGNYNTIKEFLSNGGKLNFLSSDTIKLNYDDKGEHITNMQNTTKSLLNLSQSYPESIVCKKLQNAPNISMLKISNKLGEKFIDIKFNFQGGLQMLHPLFTLYQGNPFFDLFDNELYALWCNAKEIKFNS